MPRVPPRRTPHHLFRHARPARTIFLGFLVAGVVGSGLLMLPISKAGPGAASPIEAVFTAISALCVTGLVVVDTPTYWTGFGEVVILLLIQVGGFGVMTFASLVGLAVLRRISFSGRLTTSVGTGSGRLDDARSLVLGIVTMSLIVEATVATLLAIRFAVGYGYAPGQAVWSGVFHAVSAFNNAGFALYSDSMVGFAGDPWIALPMCLAIIVGGLGFPVLVQLRRQLRTPLRWSMNTRLVLWGTGLLLVAGTLLYLLLEWGNPNTLGALDPAERVLAAFFQSVQTRTAGFNSVDTGALDPATLLGTDVLMFIGGGPAGTAGGIKVTTFGVLFFILVAEIRGDGAVNIFHKRLSRAVHRQAIAVLLVAIGLVTFGTAFLLVITDFTLDRVLFEVISAFGTVGLSTGITASLPPAGQILLVVLMFLGRLGPITFASALALRERKLLYEFPKERPIIG